MVRGKHLRLGYCGDMAAICLDCAKTHEIRVVEIAAPKPFAQDGWIPVSDRLPEPETDVLVRGVKHNGVFNTVSGLFHGRWMSQETEEPTEFKVTHWMPLPAAPKGGDV